MKKMGIILLGLLISAGIYAQQARMNASEMVSNRLFIGLEGAFTGTTIMQENAYGEPEIDYKAKFGNSYGFNVGYLLNEHIGFVTGFSFSKQGVKYADIKQQGTFYTMPNDSSATNLSFSDVSRDITTTYLNIPVLFRLSLGSPENRAKFRILVGPQFSILRNATQTFHRSLDGDEPKQIDTWIQDLNGKWFSAAEPEITDRISKNDIQIVFDMGSDFLIGNHLLLSVGFRGNYGFSDVNSEAYRLKSSRDGLYVPSNNLYGGVYMGLNYLIPMSR
jgi:hypothetical protein